MYKSRSRRTRAILTHYTNTKKDPPTPQHHFLTYQKVMLVFKGSKGQKIKNRKRKPGRQRST